MERLKRIKGAIFDLDGTLLDSMEVWNDIDVRFLAARGIEVPPDYAHFIRSMGFEETALYTIERFGLPETAGDLMREWLDMAHATYANCVPLKVGAGEYLRYLYDRGVKLAVATSSARDLFDPALVRLGVAELFSAVVTTEEAGSGKRSPAVYLRAAEKLGVEPRDCAVFEDILAGVRSANAGGFISVGVFDIANEPHAAEIEAESSIYIENFAEIPR